jgi:hypothetical protein
MTDLRPPSVVGVLFLWSVLDLASGVAVQAQVQPGAGLDNPLGVQSLEELNFTRDRPLFAPSRRPPPAAPPAVVRRVEPISPPPPPSLVLFGIVADAEGARAIIRPSPTAPMVRVRLGEEISGWKVSKIEERQLVLTLQGRSVTFTMFNNESAKPSPTGASLSRAAAKPLPNQPKQVSPAR